ncbi:obscurin-like protein 1 [Protobothrops mucrosquamatus]|uniref:obscurin-like protein 1 n=1 Tax=Protobothrops mucrosquamatus TaxID=103944 RepID=UPI0010FB27C4|nr:obscurin-like protein 1 [Protobothrops mucrosquamatus]
MLMKVPDLSCILPRLAMDAFGGAPRFLASPRTFSVQSGTNAILKWQVAGEPRPTIVWEKDGSVLELPSGRMLVEVNGDAYSLMVSQAGPADSGRYVCKAKNSVGETYAAALLKVETESELKPNGDLDCQPPIFLNRPVSACVTRGEDVTFACRVSGQLEWEKDGRKLSDIFESSHYKMDVEPGDCHFLHIYNARLPDAGVYVCRAQNSFGETMAAAVLLIDPVACLPHNDPSQRAPQSCHFKKPPESKEGKRHLHHPAQIVLSEGRQNGEVLPSFPPTKSFTVNEGKHAKFRCYVIGKPKPEIVWQKDGKMLSAGRRHLLYEDREGYFILKVLYCTARDCGLYVCTACNTAGQTLSAVRLHVREPQLRFQAPLMDVEVMEHQDAILECQVPLETMPTAWYLEDKRLQPSPKYLMEEQGLLRRLTVRDARADDDGIYLCEMEGKGRSIGELSVQGLIVKRLPRKLDVMEGENAAFYVETRESVEAPSWGRNGQELVEAPHTLIRSFGKTHILVLVHVSRHDAGVITFMAGDSQTSAQLRVKCAKRIPPNAPVEVKMCTTRSNAALLMWCPPPDLHHSPPSSYILERQTVGEAEWVPCLTTDVASMVEVPGDGVPQEADYRFRVCSANQYGCMPRAHVKEGLQDVMVCINEDAIFSVKLSAPMSGCWFLRGKKLAKEEEDQQYHIIHSEVNHTLQVKNVQLSANGSEVRFEANGVKESAVLHVQEPPVKVVHSNSKEAHNYKVADRVVLSCELSHPDVNVRWYKDGETVKESKDLLMENIGPHHHLIIPSAQVPDTGEFVCDIGRESVFFNIIVAEPPVKVVHSNSKEAHNYKVADRVVLSCELSHPDVNVRWYKDGETVKESKDLLMENIGPHHHLIIPSAQVADTGEFVCDIGRETDRFECLAEENQGLLLENEGPHCRLMLVSAQVQDTGEFVCDAGDDSAFFNITVREPPVQVVCSNADEAHTYWALERVSLTCELSRPTALVHWYKDGKQVEETEGLQLETEGPHCRLIIASAQVQHTGEFVCDVGDDSVLFTVTVSDHPVRIIHSNDEESHAYQVAERVELSCELSRPDGPVHWYKDGEEVEENEGLLLESEGPNRRLVIPSVQVQDSGEFVCDAGGDSAFFNITVTEPLVQIVQSNAEAVHAYQTSDRVVLTCELSCPNASVQWYKDGEELEEGEGLLFESDGPHRRLVLPLAQVQDTGEFVCDAGGDSAFFNVTVVDVAVCWYKDGKEVVENNGFLLENEGFHHCLVIPAAQKHDTGQYMCDAAGNSIFFNVTITEPLVQILQPAERSLEKQVQEFDCLELNCIVSIPDAPVRWFKDGLEVDETHNLLLQAEGAERRLVILRTSVEDAGEYICETKDESVSFDVTVSEPPVKILQPRRTPSVLRASTGETVTLACVLSHGNAPVHWVKDGVTIEANSGLILEEEGARRCLAIPAAGPEHSGKYICHTVDDTMTFTVQVSDPPVQIVGRDELQTHHHCLVSEDLVLSLTLSCSKGELKWYKDGEKLQDTERLWLEQDGARHSLVISAVEISDAGEYLCDSGDDSLIFHVMVEVPRLVDIISELHNLTVLEGDDATFKVVICPDDVRLNWQLNGQDVVNSERLTLAKNGLCHSLIIRQCRLSDTGIVTVRAEGLSSSGRLSVQEAQVLFVQTLCDLAAEEGQDVRLEVELSVESAEVQWMKQGVLLQQNPRYSMEVQGPKRALTIHHIELADRGTYRCESLHDRTQARLSVEPRKVIVKKPLLDVETLEKETVTFELELSHPNVLGVWTRDGIRVKPSSTCQMSATGCMHSLTLQRLTLDDTGTVAFTADTVRSCARLTVREPPVTMLRLPQDLGIPETGSATFECELSRPMAEVKWYKDGKEIQVSPNCRIYSVGRRRLLQLNHCSLEDAGEYICDAGDCRASAKLRVFERQVQIVRELEDVRVQENENAVFICEVSLAEVKGEWYHNGERLKVTSTVKIRQEGTRHFLLLTSARPEDTGQVRFVAKRATSEARLEVEALPIRIVKPLRDKTVLVRHKATLECTVSQARGRVRWFRGDTEIFAGPKYEICNLDCYRTLVIHCVEPADEGLYTCDALDDHSTARLLVEAEGIQVVQPLKNVEVMAPSEAQFECEISAPPDFIPQWSLNGEELQPGLQLQMENTGHLHKLRFCRTNPNMSGMVKITIGNARSKAHLTVRGFLNTGHAS